jgi:hypothetical protein
LRGVAMDDERRLQIKVSESLALRIAEIAGCVNESQSSLAAMIISTMIGLPRYWLTALEHHIEYWSSDYKWTKYFEKEREKPELYVQTFLDIEEANMLDVIADLMNTSTARLAAMFLGLAMYDEAFLEEFIGRRHQGEADLLNAYFRKDKKKKKN